MNSHTEQEAAGKWFPIETACKDGSVVWLRNSQMERPVKGYWGEVGPRHQGGAYLNWVSVATGEGVGFFPAGHLICPGEWSPLT